jgi:polysaccharide export outer membrane protein
MKMPGKTKCCLIYPVVLLFALTSCSPYKTVKSGSPFVSTTETSRVGSASPKPYTLGEGDQIEINVLRQEDLKRSITIDSTGYISMPYAGEIQASGLTVPQLREAITARLSKYLVDPQVDVNVAKVSSQEILVLGEVNSPGNFTIESKMTAWKAIALAGGFNTDANKRSIILLRNDKDVIRASILNLDIGKIKKDQDGATTARNVYLQGEDIIYVPPTMIANTERFFRRIQTILSTFTTLESAIVFGPEVLDALGIQSLDDGGATTGIVVSPQ